ncbi:MAG: DUF5916 domain-containing protein [bacterium]
MIPLLFFSILSVNISKVNTPPVIDGNIEKVWEEGVSADSFVQWSPDEGKAATESTKVYTCYDDKNLYVAFKCFDSEPGKVSVLTTPRDEWAGDHVWIILDTFGDKNTAYEFCVGASGVQADMKISQDGRIKDNSWDGVWYSEVKVTEYGYNVEMKIPFKTLRFKQGLDEWGVNFFRTIYRKHEDVSWVLTKQSEGMRVSQCNTLKGIQPGKQGLNLEVYPVGLLRYESSYDDTLIRPQAGLDIGWGFTSSQLSITAYPDFAQIEADPYTISLSKYETFFEERRPFFLEKQEVFNTPINLFYSRRIGKKLDYTGYEVPIIGGAKYTGSAGRVDFGVLSAYTDSVVEDSVLLEPKGLYSAGRIKMGVLENSDIGFMYSGVNGDSGSPNNQRAFGIDGTFRTRELQLASEVAKSDSGYAEYMKLDWYAPKFIITGECDNYDKSFDVEKIGYAPWKGRKMYALGAGPRFVNIGVFNTLDVGLGGGQKKEAGDPDWGYWMMGWFSPQFKNNWGGSVSLYRGKSYELDKWFEYSQTTINFWNDYSKPISFWDNIWYYTNGFNYRKMYFADMGTNTFGSSWTVSSSLSLSIELTNTFEWTPKGDSVEISSVLRPTVQYALTKDMHLRVYAEPNTDSHIHQFNALFSYNFRPKSWLYLAFNQTIDNTGDEMDMTDRIAVTKVRYLFFW